MEETTPYEQFVFQMEKTGLRKEFIILEEKDVKLSEDDSVIYITNNNCNAISIKGINEASARGRILNHPYYISIKIFGNDGKEVLPEDAVQFSITEFNSTALPTAPEIRSHVIYYHYPYSSASRIRLKRGIVITKDRRLEIRVIRNGTPLKIAKVELKIECDKWFKKEDINKQKEDNMKNGEDKQKSLDSEKNGVNNSSESIRAKL